MAIFCCQMLPAIFGSISSLIGWSMLAAIHLKIRLKSAGVLAISFCAIGSLLKFDFGSFAKAITPTYSE
ncbi:hypothetical protein D3C71_2202500 [compost metagenome]